MKRILIKQFTHSKKRYLLTLDTDGLQFYLRCYVGSSETNVEVGLTDPELRKKVISLISETEGSFLANNVMRSPEKISNRVREMHNIPYPPMPNWESLYEQLQLEGSLEYEGELEPFLSYLEYRHLPVVHFELRGKRTIIDARADRKHVEKVLSVIDEEIKVLKSLSRDIFEQKDHAERRQFGNGYYDF